MLVHDDDITISTSTSRPCTKMHGWLHLLRIRCVGKEQDDAIKLKGAGHDALLVSFSLSKCRLFRRFLLAPAYLKRNLSPSKAAHPLEKDSSGESDQHISSSKLWTRHTVQRRLTISSWMFRDWTGLNCLVGQSFSMTQSRTLTTRFQQQTFFTFGALRKNPSFKKTTTLWCRKLLLFLF